MRFLLGCIILYVWSATNLFAQNSELHLLSEAGNYKEITEKFGQQTETLSGEDLYTLGIAWFQMENDQKAIETYQKAIEKGYNHDYVYMYIALAYIQMQKFNDARKFLRIALSSNPEGQLNNTQMCLAFYYDKQLDSALFYARYARDLEYESGEPYYMTPHILHVQEKYTEALQEYYKSLQMMPQINSYYFEILKEIGVLEFVVTKDYQKSVDAYTSYCMQLPADYDIKLKLIKSCHALGRQHEADSVFAVIQQAHADGTLEGQYKDKKSAPVHEFDWNNQKVIVYQNFKEPADVIDVKYTFYVLSKERDKYERMLVTEKTFKFSDDGPEHLLCEWAESGAHLNYGIGWTQEVFTLANVQATVLQVLNKNSSPAASSSFGKPSKQKKKKEKKK